MDFIIIWFTEEEKKCQNVLCNIASNLLNKYRLSLWIYTIDKTACYETCPYACMHVHLKLLMEELNKWFSSKEP